MKSTWKLIVFIFTFLALTASAYAQSPREQLNQMVQQLQQTPTDNALREKIIKLATTLKPLPAIPEQAREPFVMGATVLKKAGDPAGAGKAVDLFTQALNIAPWFADAYYNRAVARQAAGQFEPAIDDLKLYLNFKLTDSERREVQDKVYALKANAELAAMKKGAQDKIDHDAASKAQASQAKRDVITQLKKIMGSRCQEFTPSYSADVRYGGLNHHEILGGGTFYNFERGNPMILKYFDERVEIWSRANDGSEHSTYVGESKGNRIADMEWSWAGANPRRLWAHLIETKGYLFIADVNGARPLNDAEFDPNRRYLYVLCKPLG